MLLVIVNLVSVRAWLVRGAGQAAAVLVLETAMQNLLTERFEAFYLQWPLVRQALRHRAARAAVGGILKQTGEGWQHCRSERLFDALVKVCSELLEGVGEEMVGYSREVYAMQPERR